MTQEPLPLATVFREVLDFLSGRADAVLVGAQAINAYCDPPRMTADIDVLCTDAVGLAEALRQHLADKFHIAVRVREVVDEGFRVYQVRKPKNRHLIDVRQVSELPDHQSMGGVSVIAPLALAAMKVIAIAGRKGREKELSDRLDLQRLLNVFPELRTPAGGVAGLLRSGQVQSSTIDLWTTLSSERFEPDSDLDDDS